MGCRTGTAARRSLRANRGVAALHALLGHLWDADVVQVLDCFYAFQIPPHVCPGKMGANKNTVQAVSYTVSLEDGTENTPRRNKQTCQKGEKKVYLFQRCGVIRCVGGASPAQVQGSANSLVLPLFLFLPVLYYRTNVLSIKL